MSTGFRFVLALKTDGSVVAFGNDASGQARLVGLVSMGSMHTAELL
jgi:alpha-tubulin suppressor-like RCC1 family protein